MTAPPRARIVGVVNVTADSFSDGGRFLEPAAAIARARRLLADGADRVELGAAASHPDAVEVTSSEEIRRLEPILDALLAEGLAVGVDTSRPETQRYCLERGVPWLNDIRGFPDESVYEALVKSECRLVVMHQVQGAHRADRSDRDADRVLEGIDRFFTDRIDALVSAGVARARLVVDPGMGFFLARSPEPSLAVLRALPLLRERFGLPVLVSVSRKSFLGSLTGRGVAERGAATLAAEIFAVLQGVDYVRTHDAAALRDALTVLAALSSSPT
jgi:dihydropteroate synthase type 2